MIDGSSGLASVGQVMRSVPVTALASSDATSNVDESSDSAGIARASRRAPASVTCTLRDVRVRSDTPTRCSRRRTAWLTAEGDTWRRRAARVKLRSSLTAANAIKAPNRASCIVKSSFMFLVEHEDYPHVTRSGMVRPWKQEQLLAERWAPSVSVAWA